MPAIFISYRREDSEDPAGRIYDQLIGHFGDKAVFMDVTGISAGVDFRERINKEIARCDVLFAVIGPNWLTIRYRDGPRRGKPRLEDPADFVRIEIESALGRGIPVVPVLVGGASMPAEKALPGGLKRLAHRNATEVRSGRDFLDDIVRLIRGVEELLSGEGTSNVQADRFSPSITAWMAQLKKKVEMLTADQAQTLHQIRFKNRARITGCAGSGKTLLAAEKAIRLDAAGMRTLVLCHNPNLARHLASLIRNPSIDVCDLATFVHRLAGTAPPPGDRWTAYEEPLENDLERALAAIDKSTAVYEAIIVDEGQDFRDSWWALLDALLQHSHSKTLYIFSDDNQALLPHRSNYPINHEAISMSKNCRNGGNIFEIVRRFHRGAPLVSNFLTAEGVARVTPFDDRDCLARLEEALLDAHKNAGHSQIRVLTNEPTAHSSMINGFEFVRGNERKWRAVVEQDLDRLRSKALRRAQGLRSSSGYRRSEVASKFNIPLGQTVADYLTLPPLSQGIFPNDKDIRAVKQFALKLLPFFSGTKNPNVRFTTNNQELFLIAKSNGGPRHDGERHLARILLYPAGLGHGASIRQPDENRREQWSPGPGRCGPALLRGCLQGARMRCPGAFCQFGDAQPPARDVCRVIASDWLLEHRHQPLGPGQAYQPHRSRPALLVGVTLPNGLSARPTRRDRKWRRGID